jgi:predicted anti-sigma-YlaC factor YlaD
MTCQAYDASLGNYVDGTLPPAEAARVETHIAVCARCRALAVDFDAIRSMARSLEPHVPPARVWQNVVQATRASRWPSLQAIFFAWRPAAATAMVAVIATGLWWVGDRLSVARIGRSSTAAHGGFGDPAAEAGYTSTIASLEALTRAEGTALEPGVADILDTGMTVIDAAIDQSRAALERQPDSDAAQESLFQALRTKVVLLQDTLSLVTEMRNVEAGFSRPVEK